MEASPATDGLSLGKIIKGDALAVLRTLPDGFAQLIMTSPPYWGQRDYRIAGVSLAGQYGREPTPEAHVAVMVEVGRELWRVLRDDGTLWLNYGDSYANDGKWGGNTGGLHTRRLHGQTSIGRRKNLSGLRPKNLVGMPWRIAFALQEDGWCLRRDAIWHKDNPMPESVPDRPTTAHEYLFMLTKSTDPLYWIHRDRAGTRSKPRADYRWIGAQGQESPYEVEGWRRVNLWKGHDYYYDGEAARVPSEMSEASRTRAQYGRYKVGNRKGDSGQSKQDFLNVPGNYSGCEASLRSVWRIPTQAYPGAHYATFPERLVMPPMLTATSERGACPACAAPWARIVEKSWMGDWNPGPGSNGPGKVNAQSADRKGYQTRSAYEVGSTAHRLALLRQQARAGGDEYAAQTRTVAWRPSCGCDAGDPVPCIVLDPFAGAGTVGIVAYKMGRSFVGIDLAGGDADLGGHTAHDRIDAIRAGGRPVAEHMAHDAIGQLDMLREDSDADGN